MVSGVLEGETVQLGGRKRIASAKYDFARPPNSWNSAVAYTLASHQSQ
jgi:hypothetical protein